MYSTIVRRLSALLIAVCALSVFLYGALLLMAVSHAAHLSSAQDKIHGLTTQLSAAESTYLAQTQALDAQTAVALGLSKPSSVSIVYAAAPKSLTFNQ